MGFVVGGGRAKGQALLWSISVLPFMYHSASTAYLSVIRGFCNVWVFMVIYIYIYIYICTLTEVFLTLTEVFPCFFLSCKANARVKLTKTGHGPHSSTLICICGVRLLSRLFYVLFGCKCVLPPGDNPIAVNKYINIVYHWDGLFHPPTPPTQENKIIYVLMWRSSWSRDEHFIAKWLL
jgi:hypothetical protein